ncbi:MAG: hypothetical protein ABSA02_06405 [Trebonia sp.]
MLDQVIKRLPELRRPALRGEVSKAIGAAQQVLREITADLCVDYVAAWQRDLEQWPRRLAKLPDVSSIEDALGALGLR